MADIAADTPTGNGDYVRTREMYQMEGRLKAHIDDGFERAAQQFMPRQECNERHKYIDPRVMWTVAFVLPIFASIITAVLVARI